MKAVFLAVVCTVGLGAAWDGIEQLEAAIAGVKARPAEHHVRPSGFRPF